MASGEEWEGVHKVFAANDSDDIMLDDILPGTKTRTLALDVYGHGVDRVR